MDLQLEINKDRIFQHNGQDQTTYKKYVQMEKFVIFMPQYH